MKKVILYLVLLIVLLLTSAGVWVYFEFLYTKPLNKAELAELTPDWEVVTQGNWSPWFIEADGTKAWNPAASFNAWVATIPEEEKAWPMLVDASYKYWDDIHEHEYIGLLPNDPERWAILKETLSSERSNELVEILKEALSRPHVGGLLSSTTGQYEHDALLAYGFEDDNWDPSLPVASDIISVLIPWLGPQRRTGIFLSSMAAYELEEGHVDEFIKLISLSMDSSHLYTEFPSLIGSLVEIANNAKCMDTIDWALVHHAQAFDDAQFLQLEQLIDRHKEVAVDWLGEALSMHDLIRRFTNSKGKMDLKLLYSWYKSLDIMSTTFMWATFQACSLPDEQLGASIQRAMRIVSVIMENFEDQATIPWEKTKADVSENIGSEFDLLNTPFKILYEIVSPALGNVSSRSRLYKQESIGTRTAIAVHRHRLRYGAFPESLASIDTDILTFRPVDAFTGEPLKYRLTEAGPLIYSVGDDRDDDGGVPTLQCRWSPETENQIVAGVGVLQTPLWLPKQALDSLSEEDRSIVNGDWVLYPTRREEPEPIEDDELDEVIEDD